MSLATGTRGHTGDKLGVLSLGGNRRLAVSEARRPTLPTKAGR